MNFFRLFSLLLVMFEAFHTKRKKKGLRLWQEGLLLSYLPLQRGLFNSSQRDLSGTLSFPNIAHSLFHT